MYIFRNITNDIKCYLEAFPAVLIAGARQVGKSTLAQNLGIKNHITLDDINICAFAKNDPKAFVQSLKTPVIIDEIQRAPQLLVCLKELIDSDRKNGQFVLTGSASLAGFRSVSDSLAGRIGIIDLYGLNLKELNANKSNLIDMLFDASPNFSKVFSADIGEFIVSGGYPELQRIRTQKSKNMWFNSYIRTYIEADAKELGNIRNMDKFSTAYRLCLLRSGGLFNKNDIAIEAKLDSRTLNEYLNILEHTYHLTRLQPYFSNELKRLVKMPKIYANDTGILCYLLGISSTKELQNSLYKGAVYETFVFNELLKAKSYANISANISFYRTQDKKEVDFILEGGDFIVGIEIKTAKSINVGDFKHLSHLRDGLKDRFRLGVLFYDGSHILSFGDNLLAIPFAWLG